MCARARALQRLTDSQRKAVLWRSHTSLESIDDPPKSAEEDQQLESSNCHFQTIALCDLARKIERNSTFQWVNPLPVRENTLDFKYTEVALDFRS